VSLHAIYLQIKTFASLRIYSRISLAEIVPASKFFPFPSWGVFGSIITAEERFKMPKVR
jgi:hypothetical protein